MADVDAGIMDITSMPLSHQAFVFGAMRTDVLQAVSNTFPEWRDLVDPILTQKEFLDQIRPVFQNVLATMNAGAHAFVFEAIAANGEVAGTLMEAYGRLNQPLLPYDPPVFDMMTRDFIAGYVAAINWASSARETEKRTLKRRNRDNLVKIQDGMIPNESLMQAATRLYRANRNDNRVRLFTDFSASEIVRKPGANMKLVTVNRRLEEVQHGESQNFLMRRAIYGDYERCIKFIVGKMSPGEQYQNFHPRNTTDEGLGALITLVTLLDNVEPVRPWIANLFAIPFNEMTAVDFANLQHQLNCEMWIADLVEDLRQRAGDLA